MGYVNAVSRFLEDIATLGYLTECISFGTCSTKKIRTYQSKLFLVLLSLFRNSTAYFLSFFHISSGLVFEG